MNPTDLTLEAAAMITSSGKGDTGKISDLNAPQKRRIASDLTATMQLIYTIAPAIYKRSLGANFGDPVTASIGTTDGSDVVTTAYAFGEGCSVYLGGLMNEIRTEGGVQRLRYPFAGQSGAQSAVFYSDCLILDSTIAKVIGPLGRASDRQGDIGHRTRNRILKLDNRNDAERLRLHCGTPIHYWVEPFLLGSGAFAFIVTGTLVPDSTGAYSPIGVSGTSEGDPHPIYLRSGTGEAYFISTSGGDTPTWFIRNLGADLIWTGPTNPSPVGTYTATGDNTGTATVSVASGQVSTLRLRIVPPPDARLTISYDVALRAPKFTLADLGTDDVASTRSLVVAEDYHELFVRPIFLQMFTSAPWFKGDKNLRERLAEDDKQARSLLREYRPQQESNRMIYAI